MKLPKMCHTAFVIGLMILVAGCGKQHDDIALQSALAGDHPTCDDAERDYRPTYLHLATGPVTVEALAKLRSKKLQWPFHPLSIGHSTASYQNYGSAPYFHHGLDIRQDAGIEVQAVAGGEVVNIENYMPSDAYWEVAIKDDDGYLWQYHHLERTSIPESVWQAFRSHTKVDAGTRLGDIYYWEVTTFGERYHHLHLNVLGQGGVYLNPFSFMENLNDTSTPQFIRTGLLKNGRAIGGNQVTGDYSIFTTIHDLILHEKFVLPPHEVRFSIDQGEEHVVWNFDTLPGGSNREALVHDFFVPSQTCGNYQCRKLSINLNFAKDVGSRYRFPRAPGPHSMRMIARDFAGNEATAQYDWIVQ